jgi:hypothetical protein
VVLRKGTQAARRHNAPPPALVDDVIDDDVVEAMGGGNSVPTVGVLNLLGLLDHVPVNHGVAADEQLDASAGAGRDDVGRHASSRGPGDDDAATSTIGDSATGHLHFIRVEAIRIVTVARTGDSDTRSVMVAGNDVADRETSLPFVNRLTEESTSDVLILQIGGW